MTFHHKKNMGNQTLVLFNIHTHSLKFKYPWLRTQTFFPKTFHTPRHTNSAFGKNSLCLEKYSDFTNFYSKPDFSARNDPESKKKPYPTKKWTPPRIYFFHKKNPWHPSIQPQLISESTIPFGTVHSRKFQIRERSFPLQVSERMAGSRGTGLAPEETYQDNFSSLMECVLGGFLLGLLISRTYYQRKRSKCRLCN